MGFLGIGPWEILLIFILALIILGPGKLTDFAKSLGKMVRAIRKASADLTTAVTKELENTGDKPPSEEKQSKTPPASGNQGPQDGTTGPTDRERHP